MLCIVQLAKTQLSLEFAFISHAHLAAYLSAAVMAEAFNLEKHA